MARVFAYLMGDDSEITDEAIFQDISKTVEGALAKACENGCTPTKITQTVYQEALSQLI